MKKRTEVQLEHKTKQKLKKYCFNSDITYSEAVERGLTLLLKTVK